jgi:hypothetical protein
MVLSDTAVVITGLDTVTGVRDGQPFSANGRVTFVVAKRGLIGRSCISIGPQCRTDIAARRLCVTAAQPYQNDVDKVAQLSDGLRPICWDGFG